MKNRLKYMLLVLIILLPACSREKEIKVLQFNIWQEGTVIEDGLTGIIDNIIALDPDLIAFSEVRNYNEVDFIDKLAAELEKRGMKYFGKSSEDTGILSKYEIEEQVVVSPLDNDHGSIVKARVRIGGRTVALYSGHLDWLHCSSYLPRGYDGSTWQKMEQAVTNVDSLLMDNRASFRDDEIRAMLADAQLEKEKGSIIFFGGDFNEPSHLDWQEDTKNMRDHNGVIIDWDCSVLLTENGYKDTFRELYPSAVDYPGYTFPANTENIDIKKLAWAPEADDRERIDFIYYHPDADLTLKSVCIVGPSGSILNGARVENDSQDTFIAPTGTWPTDHKALLATFILR